MDNTILLSIITVCKNCEASIGTCVSSVVGELRPEIEYLIIDGSSEDRTVEIAKGQTNKLENVHIYSEPDSGVYEAMNKGLRLSHGKYVYFLNSDDWLLPGSMHKMLDIFLANPEIDCLYGDVQTSTIPGLTNPWVYKASRNPETILSDMAFCHQGVICSREKMLDLGGFDTSFQICSDWDLMIRLYKSGANFQYTEMIVAVYSLTGLSSQKQSRKLLLNERHQIRKKYHQYVRLDWATVTDVLKWVLINDNIIRLYSTPKKGAKAK